MADGLRTRIGSPLSIGALGTFAFINFALDASGDKLEIIFQADEAITVTSLGFRYGARSGTPPTYKISLQGVDTSGNPDGTVKGATNNCLALFTPPADASIDGLWQWKVTTESYTTTRGEWLALVIDYSSGTISGPNSSTFTSHITATALEGTPYSINNAAGTRTRQTGVPIYGFKSSTTTYGFVMQSRTATTFSSGSTPDERAMKFTLPAAWGSTFQVVGINFRSVLPLAARTVLLTLYSGTTPLQTFTWDTDITAGLSGAARHCELMFDETTLSTLDYGTAYYVGLAPQEDDTILGFLDMSQAEATDWQGWPGGQSFLAASRTDSGAWTDDALTRIAMDLIIKDITEPLGHRRDMVGGMIG